jgi:hypothetical protein
MTMPGFNAEASLHERSGRYRATMYSIIPRTGIVPQATTRCPGWAVCNYAYDYGCVTRITTPGWCNTLDRCYACGWEPGDVLG